MIRINRERSNIFCSRCEVRLPENWDGRNRRCKDIFYFAPQTLLSRMHDNELKKNHRHAPYNYEHFAFLSEIAVWTYLSKRYSSLLWTQCKHIDHTKVVFRFSKVASVTLKLKKCAFFRNETYYPGHDFPLAWHEVSGQAGDATHKIVIPTRKGKLGSPLGFCNNFLWYVAMFVCIISLLAAKLGETQTKESRQLCRKDCIHRNVFRTFSPHHQYCAYQRNQDNGTFENHACDRQLGCVLM